MDHKLQQQTLVLWFILHWTLMLRSKTRYSACFLAATPQDNNILKSRNGIGVVANTIVADERPIYRTHQFADDGHRRKYATKAEGFELRVD